jgi:hypothetical protein
MIGADTYLLLQEELDWDELTRFVTMSDESRRVK